MPKKIIFNLLAKRRPVYVVSHERSGTHLAINLIFRNFHVRQSLYDAPVWVGPYRNSQDAGDYWRNLMHEKWQDLQRQGGLVKCHCEAELFLKHFPQAPVVYVMRDPRDVLVSFFYYLNHPELYRNNPWMEDQRCANFSEFLRRPLTPYLQFGFSLRQNAGNVMERWAEHVRGWLTLPGAIHVNYADMVSDYRKMICKIAIAAKCLPKLRTSSVPFGDADSILPRRGTIGDWKNHFSQEDEQALAGVLGSRGLVLSETGQIHLKA